MLYSEAKVLFTFGVFWLWKERLDPIISSGCLELTWMNMQRIYTKFPDLHSTLCASGWCMTIWQTSEMKSKMKLICSTEISERQEKHSCWFAPFVTQYSQRDVPIPRALQLKRLSHLSMKITAINALVTVMWPENKAHGELFPLTCILLIYWLPIEQIYSTIHLNTTDTYLVSLGWYNILRYLSGL